MSPLELVLLALVGFLTAGLSSVIAVGGGTILIAVLLLFMPPAVAIPFHGAVQIFSNGWRVFLFRGHVHWRLVARFAVLMPLGVVVGLWFFRGLSKEAIQLMIGLFMVSTLGLRRLKGLRDRETPLWGFYGLGFGSGILNIMVGVVAPMMAVLTVRRELNKEATIATLGMFALMGHVLKVTAFGWIGFRVGPNAAALAVLIPAVMLGGYAGKTLLGRFSERFFLAVFHTALLLLSVKLIFWDGLYPMLR